MFSLFTTRPIPKPGIRTKLIFLFCVLWSAHVLGQQDTVKSTGTIILGENVKAGSKKKHSPKLAALLSAVAPGAGQVYNRQYWKVPVVWGALGISLYYADLNANNLRAAKSAYLQGRVNLQTVEEYRRNRDYSYLFVGLSYFLNIIDASVFAHLFYFDVSENLTLNVRPYRHYSTQPAMGVQLVMNF